MQYLAASQEAEPETYTLKSRRQIRHLVELGVNAVELLPVFEYEELELQRSRKPTP